MKKLLSILSLVALFSCSNNKQFVSNNILDGIYIDEYQSSCLIINEYEEGKLGYYIYAIRNGMDNFTDAYLEGTLSINVNGKDSVAVFAEKRNELNGAVLPLVYGAKAKIHKEPDFLCLDFGKGVIQCFGRMEVKGKTKERKDAIKAGMKAILK